MSAHAATAVSRPLTLRECYDDHYQRLFRVCLRIGGGDTGFAEDVIHDVFLALHRRMQEPEPLHEVGAWLFRVTVRTACRQLRRQRFLFGSVPRALPDSADEHGPGVHEQLERSQDMATLHKALEDLPTQERVVMDLRLLQGQTQQEVAESLSYSKGYVSKLVKRASARLLKACALAVLLVSLTSRPEVPQVGGFALVTERGFTAAIASDQTIEVTAGEGSLRDHDAILTVRRGTRLRRDARGLVLLHGSLGADVRHRGPQEKPWRVSVPGGAIEVLGTRFDVETRDDGGRVTLHEGVIRFVGSGGTVTTLRPGDSYAWPEHVGKVDQVAPPSPPGDDGDEAPEPASHIRRRRHATLSSADVDAALERVAVLRDRRDDEGAARVLAATLRECSDPRTRERLSYELGTLLADRVHDSARACKRLASHLREFPDGRYAPAVRAARTSLHCGP